MTGAADRTGAPGPVQLGVVMLCHNEMPTATRMARVWAEGGARVVIHVDADVSRDAFATLMTDLAGQDRIVVQGLQRR